MCCSRSAAPSTTARSAPVSGSNSCRPTTHTRQWRWPPDPQLCDGPTIILDPAGRATAAARRTARGVPPRLRSHELLLDASQELLTLGQGQAQGGQIREVVRSGDPHNLRAAFAARGPDAYQLHDPGHAVSAHRSTSRKVPSWTRTPNLAAVPGGD